MCKQCVDRRWLKKVRQEINIGLRGTVSKYIHQRIKDYMNVLPIALAKPSQQLIFFSEVVVLKGWSALFTTVRASLKSYMGNVG